MAAGFIEIEGLGKKFGERRALDNCSLQIGRGEVFGLLGPNGAGKTTLLRLLMGFMRPSAGRARIAGHDCYTDRLAVHRMSTYLPGDARLFRSMTGRQVLRFFSRSRPEGDFQRALDLAVRLELDLSRWVAFMSTGMRQKLALAAVLSVPAELVILDEPTANLDPTVRHQVLQIVAGIRRCGSTVIFSSHVLSEVSEICDRVAILRGGELVHQQSMAELRRWYRIEGRLDESPDGDRTAHSGSSAALAALADSVSQLDFDPASGRLSLVVTSDLQPVLEWLARHRVSELEVVREGLRAVYDRFHGPRSGDFGKRETQP